MSRRIENLLPLGLDRGDSCIHILRSLFGVDWEERVRVIYAGDSASDEFAIEKLKGVAYTFRVTNEDSSAITKTKADFWLPGTVNFFPKCTYSQSSIYICSKFGIFQRKGSLLNMKAKNMQEY